jgi:hypothetical protein
MFVSDYRPTKRVGIEELDGTLRMLRDAVDEGHADGDDRVRYFEGAWIALSTLRYGSFQYPRDFVAVFERNLNEYIG